MCIWFLTILRIGSRVIKKIRWITNRWFSDTLLSLLLVLLAPSTDVCDVMIWLIFKLGADTCGVVIRSSTTVFFWFIIEFMTFGTSLSTTRMIWTFYWCLWCRDMINIQIRFWYLWFRDKMIYDWSYWFIIEFITFVTSLSTNRMISTFHSCV